MAESERDEESAGSQRIKQYVGTGVFWRFFGFTLLAAAIIIALAQNLDDVRFEWLWWAVEAPLAVVLLVTALAAGFLTELWAALRRRSRRRARTEQEELGRLRREHERSAV